MLECSRNKSFEILSCISDKPDTHESFKKALRILQQVSDLVHYAASYISNGFLTFNVPLWTDAKLHLLHFYDFAQYEFLNVSQNGLHQQA